MLKLIIKIMEGGITSSPPVLAAGAGSHAHWTQPTKHRVCVDHK